MELGFYTILKLAVLTYMTTGFLFGYHFTRKFSTIKQSLHVAIIAAVIWWPASAFIWIKSRI